MQCLYLIRVKSSSCRAVGEARRGGATPASMVVCTFKILRVSHIKYVASLFAASLSYLLHEPQLAT